MAVIIENIFPGNIMELRCGKRIGSQKFRTLDPRYKVRTDLGKIFNRSLKITMKEIYQQRLAYLPVLNKDGSFALKLGKKYYVRNYLTTGEGKDRIIKTE